MTIEERSLTEENTLTLLLCFITNVATTIQLNTPYYQGTPMPTESPTNILWLSELLTGFDKLSKALQLGDSKVIKQEVDNLVNYWTHYREEIESARINTAGDATNWRIEDGLSILNSLKYTRCISIN